MGEGKMSEVDLDPALSLVDRVQRSVRIAEHLVESDEPAIGALLSMASLLDEIQESGDWDERKKLVYGPYATFIKMANELGLSLEGRMKIIRASRDDDGGESQVDDKLSSMRRRRGKS